MKSAAIHGIILLVLCSTAGATVTDDFESYPVNTWPSPYWVGDGNADTDPVNNRVELDPVGGSNQALKLYGVPGAYWGALAYHPASFTNEYLLEMSLYNGSEDIMGAGHSNRAGITMRYGTYWWHITNPNRNLLMFGGNGTILAGDGATELATYEIGQWYDVAIHYTRNADDVTLQYWLDGVCLGTLTTPIWDQAAESSFDHLDISAGAGTAYFDDIRLYSFGGPVAIPAPGAALLGLLGTIVAGWLRRQRVL